MSRLLLLALALLMGGCCHCDTMLGNAEQPYPLPQPAQVGTIVHLPTGTVVDTAQMFAAAADARVVYVGETHDNPATHKLQLDVLEYMARRYPGRLAVGMEMFNAAQQPVLDAWIDGKLTELELVSRLDWYRNWGMDFALYRPLLLAARRLRVPLLALNVSRAEKMAAMHAAAAPSASDDPYYRAVIDAYFAAHTQGSHDSAAFIRVQNLWDDTMAGRAAAYLRAHGDKCHLLIFAGGNHIRYGFGIPRRLFKQLPVSYCLIGSEEVETAPGVEPRTMPVTLPQLPLLPWHYLYYCRYEAAPPHPQLGVMLHQEKNGVTVKKVLPSTVAAAAGIEPGDIITAIDGITPANTSAAIYLIRRHRDNSGNLQLELQRGGRSVYAAVELHAQ